jgi:hypothetical protein
MTYDKHGGNQNYEIGNQTNSMKKYGKIGCKNIKFRSLISKGEEKGDIFV